MSNIATAPNASFPPFTLFLLIHPAKSHSPFNPGSVGAFVVKPSSSPNDEIVTLALLATAHNTQTL